MYCVSLYFTKYSPYQKFQMKVLHLNQVCIFHETIFCLMAHFLRKLIKLILEFM